MILTLRPQRHLLRLFITLSLAFNLRNAASETTSCTSRDCKLPVCFCAGLTSPAAEVLSTENTPQMVMLTFDDSVTEEHYNNIYRRIFSVESDIKGSSSSGTSEGWPAAQNRRRRQLRTNPNGCPILATYYVAFDEKTTNFDVVSRLHAAGHEIASHSVTHRKPQSAWRTGSYEMWQREMAGQRDNVVRLASVKKSEVYGLRAPYLETGGDEQFRMMADEQFEYDSSMMTGPHQSGGVWPFTLDFPPSVEHCSNHNCPKRAAPGIWELPLNRWIGRDGQPCAMIDSCDSQPISKGDALSYFWQNFGRFYRGNRAPFGMHLHPDWLQDNEEYLDALETFVDSLLTDMNDVYFVTGHQVVEWMRNPQSTNDALTFEPWKTSCYSDFSQHQYQTEPGSVSNRPNSTVAMSRSTPKSVDRPSFDELEESPLVKSEAKVDSQQPVFGFTTTSGDGRLRGSWADKVSSTRQPDSSWLATKSTGRTSGSTHAVKRTQPPPLFSDDDDDQPARLNRQPTTYSLDGLSQAEEELLDNDLRPSDKVRTTTYSYEEPIGKLAESPSYDGHVGDVIPGATGNKLNMRTSSNNVLVTGPSRTDRTKSSGQLEHKAQWINHMPSAGRQPHLYRPTASITSSDLPSRNKPLFKATYGTTQQQQQQQHSSAHAKSGDDGELSGLREPLTLFNVDKSQAATVSATSLPAAVRASPGSVTTASSSVRTASAHGIISGLVLCVALFAMMFNSY